MVTKPRGGSPFLVSSYILAKNHMVTKLFAYRANQDVSYILAKNHMVTKLYSIPGMSDVRYILAKNHMVTKQ